MRKAIAVDFDGCLCENAWPEIGPPNWAVIRAALEQQRAGAALILWTCRSGELLDKAVAWCGEHGLTFDAVNENLPERLEHYGSESRKVSADEYWDDLAVRMPLPLNAPLTLDELREIAWNQGVVWCDDADGCHAGLLCIRDDWFSPERTPHIWLLDEEGNCGLYSVDSLLKCGAKFYRSRPREAVV